MYDLSQTQTPSFTYFIFPVLLIGVTVFDGGTHDVDNETAAVAANGLGGCSTRSSTLLQRT